ncbi:MAG TPA: MFS transporter, partial [Acidimicrobiales bacterium]|nr:MFS transporter [Acidimicrobiales bacterium]
VPGAATPGRWAARAARPVTAGTAQRAPDRTLLLVLSMAQFMVVLDFSIINVALPSIGTGLHVATATLQWLVSAYAVAFGGFLLLGGKLADVAGRTRLYRIGLVVFVVASAAGGLAVEPALLIASRAVQGLGAALLAPAALSLLVTSWTGEKERSRALGTYGAIVSTGFAAGAMLGGLLVQATWRLVFFVNVPVGAALLATSFRLLPPDTPNRGTRSDVPGALLVTAGVAVLVLAVTRAGDTLAVAQPSALAAVGAGLLLAFVAWERRAPSPLFDVAILKDRSILGANFALLMLGALSAGEVLLVTLYLQEGRHLSPVVTGLCFLPQAAGAFLLAGPASRSVPALGPRRVLAIAMAVALVALAGAALAINGGVLPVLLLMLLLIGVGSRLVQVAGTMAGTSGPVAAKSEGTASALLTATRQVGSAFGVAVVSALLVAARGSVGRRTAAAMLIAAAFAVIGLASTRVVPPPADNRNRRAEHPSCTAAE